MADGKDRITASCTKCGTQLTVPTDKPLKDDDVVNCPGCGVRIGTIAQIREAMVAHGKALIDNLTMQVLGKKPTWTKG